jgi:hypothetical protein
LATTIGIVPGPVPKSIIRGHGKPLTCETSRDTTDSTTSGNLAAA